MMVPPSTGSWLTPGTRSSRQTHTLRQQNGPAVAAMAQVKPAWQYLWVSGSQSPVDSHAAVQVARAPPPSTEELAAGGWMRQSRDGHSKAGELIWVPRTSEPCGLTH